MSVLTSNSFPVAEDMFLKGHRAFETEQDFANNDVLSSFITAPVLSPMPIFPLVLICPIFQTNIPKVGGKAVVEV